MVQVLNDKPLEIGPVLFSQSMVIVEDQDLRFPENTDLIIGADMLIGKQLDISTCRWGLVQEEELLESFVPSLVNNILYEFSKAEQDYIQNSAEYPELGLEDEDKILVDTSSCSSSRGYDAGAESEPPKEKRALKLKSTIWQLWQILISQHPR